MLSKLFSPTAKLEVQITHNVVFVYPSLLPGSGRSALPESALGGVVNVLLPMRRRVSSICVIAKGVLHRTHLDPLGSGTLTQLEMRIDFPVEHEGMEPGSYEFPFEFKFPASSQASESSCNPVGHIIHTVTAVLEFSTGLLTSVSSPAVRIFVIPLRDEPGAVPDPFDFSYEQALSIGPVRVHLFSPHLTVGSLLHLNFLIASPPMHMKVTSIRLQDITSPIFSPTSNPTPVPDFVTPISHVADTGSSPVVSEWDTINKEIGVGKEWCYRGIFAMPSCWTLHERASASTLEGSDTHVKTSHSISIQLRYTVGISEDLQKATTILIPVIIDSCASLIESLRLPPYATRPPNTKVRYFENKFGNGGTWCMCEYTLEERLERYRGALKAAGDRCHALAEDEALRSPLIK